jgi:hypothetical protein
MYKLALIPESDGFQVTDGNEVIAIALDGGASRFRRDKLGASSVVNVRWVMDPGQWQYWRAFYRTATKRGSLPFLCDLLSEDGSGLAEHTCSFVPGSVRLPEQRGLMYVQEATLEVTPIAGDEEFDMSLILLYAGTGDLTEEFVGSIEELVNVTMPENLAEA